MSNAMNFSLLQGNLLGRAFITQLLGILLPIGLGFSFFPPLLTHSLAFAAVQGFGAALISQMLRCPVWWIAIHLCFMPFVILAHNLDLSAWIWFVGFIALLMIFWRTDKSRVPLYLTNSRTGAALASQFPETSFTFVDLGCGDGGLLRQLARLRPDCHFVGLEHAPLTWAWAKLFCLAIPNIRICLGDFWKHRFENYDFVYAFLSPIPMCQLWLKAQSEMQPNAQLISNSFAIPDIESNRTVTVNDRRSTQLFYYLPASKKGKSSL